MTPPLLPCDNLFWQFSLRVYGAHGVPDECLAAQDILGADVNVLLFCGWLAVAHGIALDERDIAAIVDRVRSWHDNVVRPLRGVRRYMKTAPDSAYSEVLVVRNQIKAAEIEAEQIEQALLFMDAIPTGRAKDPRAPIDLMRANVRAYLRSCANSEGPESELPTLDLLIAAAAANGAC